MSIKVMSRVWESSSQEGSALLLLLAIADHANDDGVCWPSVDRLAERARVGERWARRTLRRLEEAGEIIAVRGTGRGNTNVYLVTIGMSEQEIRDTLVRRVGVDPQHAGALASRAVQAREKPALEAPISETKKGASSTKKGASSVQKGGLQTPQNHHEPSRTVSSGAAGAARQPSADSETADFEQMFPGRVARSRPPSPPPRSVWGSHSKAAEKLLQRYGDRAPRIRHLGEVLEDQFGLVPDWGSKREIKSWIAGLDRLLTAADGNVDLAAKAARKLLTDGLTVSDPWSIVKTARALAAEKRRAAPVAPLSVPVERYV